MRVRLLGRELEVSCAAGQEGRVSDLAAVLEARIGRDPDNADDVTRLVVAALALVNEAQVAHVALERARLEIERLTDLMVEARPPPDRQIGADDRLAGSTLQPYAVQGTA